MLTGLAWLGLEAKSLASARKFYEDTLEMTVRSERDGELAIEAGKSDLRIRRPTAVPRGGLHTHYALSIPADTYDDWWDRLEAEYDLEEAQFGSTRSLYLYDPDGNCVELGQSDVDGPGIDGIFEVVLEVESLERAESLYAELGFETVDRGDRRTRVRMDGPIALELWEPHLGIADARGGVHVDLGFETEDPKATGEAIADRVARLEFRGEGDAETAVARDFDGHHLTFAPSENS
ncbi:fosmidomycin resistance protein [Halostagnicola larsenii XH-48]|uniref:Fosmidomycin resistance protein n=1 Tax=Halostagnicola larsenii XH-48 TaxID=797299 RepID=W0JJV9_9EURY|nr:VOC family protein [Halostagnicola larsenii]AHF98883.1 fosmidomycin resistance protein [Halostagnicola larsenii XH-48]